MTAAPRPLAADGRVDHDPDTRTLIVRPAKVAPGYAKLLWREGHAALVNAGNAAHNWAAYVTSAPAVYADGAGQRRVAPGPGADGSLRFQFPRGDPAHKEMVSTPGLTATVVIDRETRHIMGVKFHGRRT